MRLRYNSSEDIAIFPIEGDPYIKLEYTNKTFYCVYCLKKDYYSTRDLGFCSPENKWYNKGYYVIPVYLKAYKWICGNKVVMIPRSFCDMLGRPWNYEPQDVPEKQWWISHDFKNYWSIAKTSLGYLNGYIEDVELYDDVNEAIQRAKELDELMILDEQFNDIVNKLELRRKERDNIVHYLNRYSYRKTNGTERQKLEYQLKELTYKRKLNIIDKLIDKKKKVECKKIHISGYLLN